MNELPIILLGMGGVGRALVKQILALRSFHAQEYGLRIRFLALCDSRSALLEPEEGLSDSQIGQALMLKEAGRSLAQHELGGTAGNLSDIVDIAGRPGTVVVDCTATEQTVPTLLFALERGYKLVLANKKPLTVQQEAFDRLTRAGSTGERDRRRARWETTVGAGLPVIATLNRLIASGDPVSQITGTFSGTLGFLMTGLEAGRAFSQVVTEAYELGYTEPDPRDDLGGVDVARKALILARGLGHRLEMADIAVDGLYPTQMADLSVAEFMARLHTLDGAFARRVEQAAAQGQVLRYAASLQMGDGAIRAQVGPFTVDRETPLGRLTGTDNLVAFTTRWYAAHPLVIQGAGAGVDVTAAGVLSDIIELA
jgi:homoserine dehydrogenase